MEGVSALCLQTDIITYGDSCFLMPLRKGVNKNISLHFAGNKASKQSLAMTFLCLLLLPCCDYCQILS